MTVIVCWIHSLQYSWIRKCELVQTSQRWFDLKVHDKSFQTVLISGQDYWSTSSRLLLFPVQPTKTPIHLHSEATIVSKFRNRSSQALCCFVWKMLLPGIHYKIISVQVNYLEWRESLFRWIWENSSTWHCNLVLITSRGVVTALAKAPATPPAVRWIARCSSLAYSGYSSPRICIHATTYIIIIHLKFCCSIVVHLRSSADLQHCKQVRLMPIVSWPASIKSRHCNSPEELMQIDWPGF
jgi:hypothetical protein